MTSLSLKVNTRNDHHLWASAPIYDRERFWKQIEHPWFDSNRFSSNYMPLSYGDKPLLISCYYTGVSDICISVFKRQYTKCQTIAHNFDCWRFAFQTTDFIKRNKISQNGAHVWSCSYIPPSWYTSPAFNQSKEIYIFADIYTESG